MDTPLTKSEFLCAFSALAYALHENNVLTLDQLTDSMEGSLARRKVDLGETSAGADFAFEILRGLHRLNTFAPKSD